MAIYVFSLLVGYVPNGVDNAQGMRDKYLSRLSADVIYVYEDMPTDRYVKRYCNLGIHHDKMISLHLLPTGNAKIGGPEITEVPHHVGNKLIAQEYVSDRLLFTDYYTHNQGQEDAGSLLCKRSFKRLDGSTAYDSMFDEKGQRIYLFPDGEICNQYEFYEKCIEALNLSKDDIILLDRPNQLPYMQALFSKSHGAKIIPFLHSGHYYEKNEDPDCIYMNKEYYFYFKHANYIDTFLVSTQEQRDDLIRCLEEYGCRQTDVVCLPICGIDSLRCQKNRIPFSLLTVARHDPRKKLDIAIRSVILAHERIPELFLDLYGRGDEEYTDYLKEIVVQNGADSYIHFKGYCDVKEVYKNYEAYLSTSLWETFGLTLLEATASGNAIVGFNVRYGNRLFIKNNENGYLVNLEYERMDEACYVDMLVESLADRIVKLFSDSEKLSKMQEKSYEIASEFWEYKISKQWCKFMEEKME